jgi:RND family efflux transporter MFP subunit
MSRIWIVRLLSGSAIIAALVVVGWFYLKSSRAREMSDPALARKDGRPIPVRTAIAEEADVDVVTGATCVTIPSFTTVIRIPPTGGLAVRYVPPVTDMVIKKVHVREGDYVRKGQPLFETDNEFFLKVLEQRKSAVVAAEAQLERAKASVAYNQKVRQKELESAESEVKFRTRDIDNRATIFSMESKLGRSNSSSRVEFHEAKSRNDQAEFDLDEGKRRLEWARDSMRIGPLQDKEELTRAVKDLDLARIDYEETRRGVERSVITSPIDGFIDGKSDIVPGQTVEVVRQLARVLQVDPIHVQVDFPQERLDSVRVGQKAEIVLDSFRGEKFIGTIIRTSAQVNPQLRIFPVIVELPNPDHRIRPGISGYARLNSEQRTVTVPTTALIQHGDRAMVFRVEEDRARLREVIVGAVVGEGRVAITSGLAPGEEVVVYHSNFYKHWGDITRLDAYLKDGDLVNTDWRRWTRRE